MALYLVAIIPEGNTHTWPEPGVELVRMERHPQGGIAIFELTDAPGWAEECMAAGWVVEVCATRDDATTILNQRINERTSGIREEGAQLR